MWDQNPWFVPETMSNLDLFIVLIWEDLNDLIFKTASVGLVWGSNHWSPAQQAGVLATELTRYENFISNEIVIYMYLHNFFLWLVIFPYNSLKYTSCSIHHIFWAWGACVWNEYAGLNNKQFLNVEMLSFWSIICNTPVNGRRLYGLVRKVDWPHITSSSLNISKNSSQHPFIVVVPSSVVDSQFDFL